MTPTREAAASSFKALDTPPRVGSRIARIAGTGFEHHPGQAGQRGGVAFQDGLELDPLADRHDGDPVVADRARDEDAVAGPGRADRERPALGHEADAGGGDEDLVALAAVDDLGVAGDQRDARLVARLRASRRRSARRSAIGQPFFEDERRRQVERLGPADRQVVDRAVHRQLADVAAGEEERPDDERIGGERDPRRACTPLWPAEPDGRLVLERGQHVVAERRHEQPLRSARRVKQAAAAVAEHDVVVLRPRQRAGARSSSASRAISGFLRLTTCGIAGWLIGFASEPIGRSRLEMAAVGVVGGTGPFGRDHRRAQRRLRRAFAAERRAVVRLLQPLEDLPADADRRFLRLDAVDVEEPLGVVVAILVAQLEAALRDQADAPPLAVADLEDVVDQPPGRGVALGPDGPGVRVLDLGAARFELPDASTRCLRAGRAARSR